MPSPPPSDSAPVAPVAGAGSGRPMALLYLGAIVLEIATISLLWAAARHFG